MRTEELHIPRPSSEVEAQLEQFKATLPNEGSALKDDFAAQLQWDAWQGHLKDLEAELETSIAYELENSDVVFSLDGDPVVGHDIQAGFLGRVLATTQSLVDAITQSFGKPTPRAAVPNIVLEESRLLIAGGFDSSFGIKFRFATSEELQRVRAYDPNEVMAVLGRLLDPEGTTDDLLSIFKTSSRIKSHYKKLVEEIGDNNAQIVMRTQTRRAGVRLKAAQARDRKAWLDTIVLKPKEPRVIEGELVGGSTSKKRFELRTGGEPIIGDIAEEVVQKLVAVHWNQRVRATIQEIVETPDETEDTGKVSFLLIGLEPISD